MVVCLIIVTQLPLLFLLLLFWYFLQLIVYNQRNGSEHNLTKVSLKIIIFFSTHPELRVTNFPILVPVYGPILPSCS